MREGRRKQRSRVKEEPPAGVRAQPEPAVGGLVPAHKKRAGRGRYRENRAKGANSERRGYRLRRHGHRLSPPLAVWALAHREA